MHVCVCLYVCHITSPPLHEHALIGPSAANASQIAILLLFQIPPIVLFSDKIALKRVSRRSSPQGGDADVITLPEHFRF